MKQPIQILFVVMCWILACACHSSGKVADTNDPVQQQRGDSIPACVQLMIKTYKEEERQNPPRQVFQYRYKGDIVYYVTPPCCDFFSELYNKDCQIIAYPDGGITGKGDGRAPDFLATRQEEKLIWQDERKP